MALMIPADNLTRFVNFIKARERHRKAKEHGAWNTRAKPDPIIAQYRFCNVRRNDDRVTKWIHENYLNKWRGDKDLWFALVVARLFNNEPTLDEISRDVLPFKPGQMRGRLHAREKGGDKCFNAAYIVSTNGRAMGKVEYLLQYVLQPMWDNRAHISHQVNKQETLAVVHQTLCDQDGLASFMAAQVVADLKYADPNRWADFHTFAASGPGSRRGLNRMVNRNLEDPWKELLFRETLLILRDKVNVRITDMEAITAQDIQNCLCEFDKYERARIGQGRPKQLYHPALKGE